MSPEVDTMPNAAVIAPTRALVVAIGHRSRRDDGVGGELVRRLEGRLPEGATALDLGPNPLRLFDVFERAETEGARVIVADAVASGATPGTLHRFTGTKVLGQAVRLRGATSSHGFDLAATLALADRLGRLPDDLVIFGVEIGDVGRREGLSPEVAAAVEEGVEKLLREIGRDDEGAG